MSVREFVAHVRDTAPSFRCYACGDHLERLNLIAKVSNDLNPPASAEALAEIESLLGAAGKLFQQLYGSSPESARNGAFCRNIMEQKEHRCLSSVRVLPFLQAAVGRSSRRTSKLLAGIREEALVLPGFAVFWRLQYASAG